MTMELLSWQYLDGEYVLNFMITRRISRPWYLPFGKLEYDMFEMSYRGGGTVWYEYPAGIRALSYTESVLCTFVKRIKWGQFEEIGFRGDRKQ